MKAGWGESTAGRLARPTWLHRLRPPPRTRTARAACSASRGLLPASPVLLPSHPRRIRGAFRRRPSLHPGGIRCVEQRASGSEETWIPAFWEMTADREAMGRPAWLGGIQTIPNRRLRPGPVTPAKAGDHCAAAAGIGGADQRVAGSGAGWIPACAGMTEGPGSAPHHCVRGTQCAARSARHAVMRRARGSGRAQGTLPRTRTARSASASRGLDGPGREAMARRRGPLRRTIPGLRGSELPFPRRYAAKFCVAYTSPQVSVSGSKAAPEPSRR